MKYSSKTVSNSRLRFYFICMQLLVVCFWSAGS